eukprot:Opistho-1_new@61964
MLRLAPRPAVFFRARLIAVSARKMSSTPQITRTRRQQNSGGVRIVSEELSPAQQPPQFAAVFVHGNGFCRTTWDPVVEDLQKITPLRAITVDLRGHGESGDIPDKPRWEDFMLDTVTVARDVRSAAGSLPVIGVGHSMGSTALLMAQLRDPSLFDALYLIEPIIFPPASVTGAIVSPDTGKRYSDMARKRRATFASKDAAVEYFTSRLPGWDKRSIYGFVSGAFVDDPATSGVRLRASPEQEVQTYSMAHNDVWSHLGEIRVPTLFVHGALSWSHGDAMMAAMAASVGGPSKSVRIENASHVVNMEAPGTIASDVADFVIESTQPTAARASL